MAFPSSRLSTPWPTALSRCLFPCSPVSGGRVTAEPEPGAPTADEVEHGASSSKPRQYRYRYRTEAFSSFTLTGVSQFQRQVSTLGVEARTPRTFVRAADKCPGPKPRGTNVRPKTARDKCPGQDRHTRQRPGARTGRSTRGHPAASAEARRRPTHPPRTPDPAMPLFPRDIVSRGPDTGR